jgi:hypothetical protein
LLDQLRCRAIERAQIEADLAQRRFMLVDPSNRLVADTLEAEWNDELSYKRLERGTEPSRDTSTAIYVTGRDRLAASGVQLRSADGGVNRFY